MPQRIRGAPFRVLCVVAIAATWLVAAPACRAQARRNAVLRVGVDRTGDITGTLYLPQQPKHPHHVLANLSAALGVPLAGIVTWHNEYWVLQGRCVDGAHRSGLFRRCSIHQRALLPALRAASAISLQLVVIYSGTPHIRFSLPPDHAAPPLEGYSRLVWQPVPVDVLPKVVTVVYGYSPTQAMGLLEPYLAILLLAAILPLASLIAARRRSTPEAAFAATVAIVFAGVVFRLSWLALWIAGDGFRLIQFAAESGVDRIGIGAVTWCVFLPVVAMPAWTAWCLFPLVKQQVQPDCSRARYVLFFFLRNAVWIAVMLCGIQAILGLFGESPTEFGRWLAAAAVVGTFGQTVAVRMRGITAFDLAETALGARIRELAAAARAPMRRALLIKSGIFRMVNATATARGVVSVMEPMLAALDREQTDAIIRHEVGHTSSHDVRWLTLAAAVVTGITLGVGALLSGSFSAMPVLLLVPIIGAATAGMLVHRSLSRRLEYRADAAGTIGAEEGRSLIEALALVHRHNGQPLQWGRATELLTTHPTTIARIRAIAARSGIPAGDVDALVAAAAPHVEHYIGGAISQPPKWRTRFTCADAGAAAGIISAILAATPAALLARFAPASPQSQWMILLGAAATAAVILFAARRVQAACYLRLFRWHSRHGGSQTTLLLAPSDAERCVPRDIGSASAIGDGFKFEGADYAFMLPFDQIESVVPKRISWSGWRMDTVTVVWRAPGTDSSYSLRLCRSGTAAVHQAQATSLTDWLQYGPATPGALSSAPPRWIRDATSPSGSLQLLPVVGFTALLGLVLQSPVQAANRMGASEAILSAGLGVLVAAVLRRRPFRTRGTASG